MMPITDTPRLRQRVLDELRWDPSVDTRRIEVDLIDAVAVLHGAVRSYAEKCDAEEIVKRTPGVSGVRNQLQVRLTIGDYRTDATLARIATEVLECLARLPEARPRPTVASGWVTLEGTVPWAFQKRLAEEAIRGIAGILGITNLIRILPREEPADDLDIVLTAVLRRRSTDPDAVAITAAKGRIVVRGKVESCAERDALLDLAWCAAGVHAVEDQVRVRC